MPAKQSIGRDDRANLGELPAAQLLGSLGEATSLNVGEPHAFPTHLLSKGSILFPNRGSYPQSADRLEPGPQSDDESIV